MCSRIQGEIFEEWFEIVLFGVQVELDKGDVKEVVVVRWSPRD